MIDDQAHDIYVLRIPYIKMLRLYASNDQVPIAYSEIDTRHPYARDIDPDRLGRPVRITPRGAVCCSQMTGLPDGRIIDIYNWLPWQW